MYANLNSVWCGRNMKIKTLVLGSLLAFCLPLAAEAQMTSETSESYENYQISCNSNSEYYDPTNPECDSFDVNYEADSESKGYDEYSQRRTRRSRRSSSTDDVKRPYAGASLGIFFPEGDLNTSFGGSVFGGYKFTPYVSGEGEFLFFFGGIDEPAGIQLPDDNYSVLGFLANAKFEYPLKQGSSKSPVGFVTPGIGFARAEANGSDTKFAFQVKAGVEFPVKEKYDLFAQGRYINIDDFDTFSVEGGIKFGL